MPIPAFSIFTPEYVGSLDRVFRRIFPAMALTELLRAALAWPVHPLDAGLNAAFAVMFLGGTLGLWWERPRCGSSA